jgi:molecular chaperone Hsp33
MLHGLGRAELDSIIAERGNVEIGCEFCGLKYHFDTIDVSGLFTPQADQAPGSPTVQ